MPGSFYGALYDTVGMEIEGISHTREFVAQKLISPMQRNLGDLGKYLSITRDASTEFVAEPFMTKNGIAYFSHHTSAARKIQRFGQGNAQVMGYEIITSPLPVGDLEKIIYPLTFGLRSLGDFVSHRAAIHFHVGFGNNLRLLKNVLRLSLNLDPVLFRLGGMGGTFRGKINQAAYARPLLNSTVAIVDGRPYGNSTPMDGRLAQTINPMNAVNALTLEEFWASFGVKYELGGGNVKYHPCRYQGINFYSIPQHGTIEFRHFNKSMDSALLVALAKFLRASVEMVSLLSKHEISSLEVVPSNTEISVGDGSEILTRVYRMCADKEVEDLPTEFEMAILLQTLENSHFEAIPDTPVKTHLREFYLNPDVVYLGKLKLVKEATESCHVDIHNIRNISIFNELLEKIEVKSPSEMLEDDDEGIPPLFLDEQESSEESEEEVW